MKRLIRHNPKLGKKDMATLAAEEKIVNSRNVAMDLLEQGIVAKVWESVELPGKSHKQLFRMLKGEK